MKFSIRFLALAVFLALSGTAHAELPAAGDFSTTVDGVTIPFGSAQTRNFYLAQIRAGKDVFLTPKPAYPFAAKQQRLSGHGVVRATFTRPGHPTRVQMIRSTGSSLLDKNTLVYAAATWLLPRHSRGFPQTKDVPVTYVLDR